MRPSCLFLSFALILGSVYAQDFLIGTWSNPTVNANSDLDCCVPTSIEIETVDFETVLAKYTFPNISQQGFSTKCSSLFNGTAGNQGSLILFKNRYITYTELYYYYNRDFRSYKKYNFRSTNGSSLNIEVEYLQTDPSDSYPACNFTMGTKTSSFGSAGVIFIIIFILIIIGLVAFKLYQRKQETAIIAQIYKNATDYSFAYQPVQNPVYAAPNMYSAGYPNQQFVQGYPQQPMSFVQPGQVVQHVQPVFKDLATEEDIIVKCKLEEMVKQFFKDYVIVWHDPNMNSRENKRYLIQLEKFCEVKLFTEWKKASDYITEIKATCHVITSGTNGEVLVKEIFPRENVSVIYIFCGNKDHHSTWAKNYQKVSCIETHIQSLLDCVKQNLLEWYKHASSLRMNLPAFAPIFNDSDKSEMNNLHRYLKVIPNFKNRLQAKNDFLNLSRAIYSDQNNISFMASFEKTYNEYNKEAILRWYTQESFLYKVTNNSLRIATSDSIQYCRLLLRDIERAIKEQYQGKSKHFCGLLYRGAYLSEEEWLNLRENMDKEIEMHGFLSVSKVQNVALNFISTDPSKKVLITIIVPKSPNETEQGFAEVEEFSKFPQEKEILFNVRSRFTVLETEDQYSQDLPCRHLVLLYGAQDFRKFLVERNPVQEVSIKENAHISCTLCKVVIQQMSATARMFFASLTYIGNNHNYYCQKCLPKLLKTNNTPLLCVPLGKSFNKGYITKIKGCILAYPMKTELEIPLYGYKCHKCQEKKRNLYFKCTECPEKKEKWCENCVLESGESCMKAGHAIVVESNPFSFWCEKMSENELKYLEFQNKILEHNESIFQQAEMYFESHNYQRAIEYYSIYIQQNERNEKDKNLAASYNNIGSIYSQQGEYKKALEYNFKALEIFKSIYGDNHPVTATSYSNLGDVSHKQGEYKKALEYHFKSLEIRKSVNGDNHPQTAAIYNNIGGVYSQQGEYKKALEYYFKSLEIRKSVNGDNHPEIASCYNNIGVVYRSQEEYEKTLEYYFKALEILKSIYGDNHPNTATSYNNIGVVYKHQGEYKKALEYSFKSLETRKSLYGDNHPDTASSYNNIGGVFHKQGEYDKALEYDFKALEILKSIYGDNHPNTATSYSNLGDVYSQQREYDKALEYYFKSLEIEKSVYGDNHPEIATSSNKIGGVYYRQGEYKKALEYNLKSLEIYKAIYGDNHSQTATSYGNIGILYESQRDYKNALEYYFKSLAIVKSVHGDNHPATALSYNFIGDVYKSQGDNKKALEYFFKSLEILKSIYGNDHRNTVAVMKKLLSISEILKNETHIDV